jgi:hypothetical protein
MPRTNDSTDTLANILQLIPDSELVRALVFTIGWVEAAQLVTVRTANNVMTIELPA